MSEEKRRAEFLRSGYLKKLGINKSDESVELDNVQAAMYDYAANVIAEGVKILNKSGATSTGNLEKSWNTELETTKDKYTLTISLAPYWDYVNSGVKGYKNEKSNEGSPYKFKNQFPAKKMIKEIKKWIEHNVGVIKNETTKKKTNAVYRKQKRISKHVKKTTSEQLAVAYSISIKKKGLRAVRFVDKARDKYEPKLNKEIAKALKEDFKLVVRKINLSLENGNDNKEQPSNK